MKILHVEDHFFPSAGYQINLLTKYMSLKGHEINILCSKPKNNNSHLESFFNMQNIDDLDAKLKLKYGIVVHRVDTLFNYSGRMWLKINLKKFITDLNPDIIFAHGNDTLTSMRLIQNIHRLKVPIISDSHMLLMASKNKFAKIYRLIYKQLITKKIIKNSIFVIKTQENDYVNDYLGVPKKLTPYISFGTDPNLFKPSKINKKNFRKKNMLMEDDKILVYAGKIDADKGSHLLAEAVKCKFEKRLVIIIVGNFPENKYGKDVKDLFISSENKILFFPTQNYVDLPYYYQVSDYAVYPKQSSLSFFDVQAVGLPVIAEDNDLNKTRINQNNGILFKQNNSDDLRNAIGKLLYLENDSEDSISKNIRNTIIKKYDYDIITDQYLSKIKEQIKIFGGKIEN